MKKAALSLILSLAGPLALLAEPRTTVIQIRGLEKPAEIRVDTWGVPHIYAKTEADAFFVQGVNAARDRLFQIDLWRRRGLGLLSEVLGPGYVEQDTASRLFLYRGDMVQEWAAYGPGAQAAAASFVSGINAWVDWLATHPDQVPVEFRILGYSPAHWDVADIVRIRSHGLTRNLTSEVARSATVAAAGPTDGPRFDQVRMGLEPRHEAIIPEGLDPHLPPNLLRTFTLATSGVKVVKPGVKVALDPEPTGESLTDPKGSAEGSNNWAIAPARSSTGRPILAGDPHRAYSTPSLRYIVHLSAPGLDIIGAGEPALPGISMGHNGTAAFGLTIFAIDQEDLYVYELNPANPGEYRYRGGWEPFRTLHESVPVKGAGMADAALVFTRHGPVIFTDAAHHRAYAVRTCWLEPGTAPYFGSLAYMRAKTFGDFKKAMVHSAAPSENQVYADISGNIGWVATGMTPIRRNWDGLLPVPGDGRYEWEGFWPADRLPGTYNPPSGFITTSNELNVPSGFPMDQVKIGFEWANPSRHRRIEEVLTSKEKFSIEDSMRLQNDQTSIPMRRLVARIAPLTSQDPGTQAALELLKGWDANLGAASPQAALAEVWVSHHLSKAYRTAALPAKVAASMQSTDLGALVEGLDNPGTSLAVPADRILLASLGAAWLETQKLLGPDPKSWRWGNLHHQVPPHPLAEGSDPELKKRLQPGPYSVGGDANTPNASSYRATDFLQTGGPSFRMVLDVGNWDNSRAMNFPGQSGNPDDPHYADLAKSWIEGGYFPLLYSRAAVEAATETRFLLQPL